MASITHLSSSQVLVFEVFEADSGPVWLCYCRVFEQILNRNPVTVELFEVSFKHEILVIDSPVCFAVTRENSSIN